MAVQRNVGIGTLVETFELRYEKTKIITYNLYFQTYFLGKGVLVVVTLSA
jgi:hypothetical protein